MITLTLNTPFHDVIGYIDKQADLDLVAADLCQVRHPSTSRHGLKTCETVSENIHYLMKDSEKAELAIFGTERNGERPKIQKWGVAVTGDPRQTRIHLELFDTAVEKRVIHPVKSAEKDQKARKLPRILEIPIAIACLILLCGLFVLLAPVLLTIAGVGAVTYVVLFPIIYLMQKRRFRAKQKGLARLARVFEERFAVVNKEITKDWVSFFGRVRNGVKEVIKDEVGSVLPRPRRKN